jgi:hypothetical protein
MQALTGDFAARLDSPGYRRYCLRKFAGVLEALRRVFFKECLK